MADSSPNDNDGQYLNGVVLGAPGAIAGDGDSAATFDGVNDIGRVPDSSSLDVGSVFTAEGWIRRTSNAKTTTLMNKGNNGLQLVVMNAGAGSQVWLRKTNVTTIARSSGGVPADGRFHHVVATMNGPGATARIYIDGVDQTVVVGATQLIANTTFPLVFGGAGSDPADFDELALYGRALSGAEVAEHHRAATSLTITKTGPLAVFRDQEFDYAISVKNNGASTVTGVEVVDTLPAAGTSSPAPPPAPRSRRDPARRTRSPWAALGPGATVDVDRALARAVERRGRHQQRDRASVDRTIDRAGERLGVGRGLDRLQPVRRRLRRHGAAKPRSRQRHDRRGSRRAPRSRAPCSCGRSSSTMTTAFRPTRSRSRATRSPPTSRRASPATSAGTMTGRSATPPT